LLTAGLAPSFAAQDRISVDVNLVVLRATVTDRKGMPVSGLDKQDFTVYDEGVPQNISLFSHDDVPVTVGLIVDHSGSMGPKIRDVVAAAETFARASNPADQMFVLNFNEHVSFGRPGALPFTADPAELQRAIASAPTTGRTALYDAVMAGLQRLGKGTRDKKVLMVISDGGDNASHATLAQAMKAAKESDAIIYTIGIFDEDDPDRNPRALKELARATGGEAFLPESSGDLVGICQRIAKDIRSQYTLGFAPAAEPAGANWRTLRVEATAPRRGRLKVRTRAGYYR
jgi:Ca-activated chloride channel homolog